MHGEDFIKSVFREYANESDCLIHEHGFDHLLHDLAVAEHAGHEHEHEHSHGHSTRVSSEGAAYVHNERTYGLILDFWGEGLVQAQEDEHNHEHEHAGGNSPINASYNVTIMTYYYISCFLLRWTVMKILIKAKFGIIIMIIITYFECILWVNIHSNALYKNI